MAIGFTGTQDGMTSAQLKRLSGIITGVALCSQDVKKVIVHHGGCVGADIQFDELCCFNEFTRIVHPSNIKNKQGNWKPTPYVEPELPPLERNKIIVDKSNSILAAPRGRETTRSGTWATIRYARKRLKPIVIIYPDGKIGMEN